MRFPPITGNWGLKVLALVLAIVTYYALKQAPPRSGEHDATRIFQYR